jgi:hypothetical protein
MIETVVCYLWLDFKMGRMVEIEPAMHLPPRVPPKPRAMAWMRGANGLALMPIPHVMRSDHAKRACHPNKGPKPDERVFQPFRCLK